MTAKQICSTGKDVPVDIGDRWPPDEKPKVLEVSDMRCGYYSSGG